MTEFFFLSELGYSFKGVAAKWITIRFGSCFNEEAVLAYRIK